MLLFCAAFGELVHRRAAERPVRNESLGELAADDAASAGDENVHHAVFHSVEPNTCFSDDFSPHVDFAREQVAQIAWRAR